ncbi:MAG TPA: glucosaminidase domain-containing protein [Polyangiaceae bacterium]
MVTGPSRPAVPPEPPNGERRPEPPPRSSSSFRALSGARTPLGGDEAALHLARAWSTVLGEPAPARALELLWAQWALETGRGQAMRGNNFGGIKAERGGALLETTEGFGSSRTRVKARFRTYSTPEDGARDHVSLIARRYPGALEALRRGDAAGFVRELSQGGYFTADPETYRRGIEQLAAEHASSNAGGSSGGVASTNFVDGVLLALRPRATEP